MVLQLQIKACCTKPLQELAAVASLDASFCCMMTDGGLRAADSYKAVLLTYDRRRRETRKHAALRWPPVQYGHLVQYGHPSNTATLCNMANRAIWPPVRYGHLCDTATVATWPGST